MKGRALAVAFFLGVSGALIVPEAQRYSARIELNRVESLIRYAQADTDSVRKKAALLNARDRLEALALRIPNDVRPPYLRGASAQLRGEPREALEAFRDSMAVQERPVVDFAMSRAYQASGNAENAAACALRAVWLSPWLRWQLPKPARRPLESEVRRLEERLREGDVSAIPELPP